MLVTALAGQTSLLVEFPIFNSSSTTGALLTGVTYNASGLTGYYDVAGASGSATSLSLATMTKGTWATGGFVAVDATNMPGVYQLGVPNACIASAGTCTIYLSGASNMVPVVITIQVLAANVAANVAQWNGSAVAVPNVAGVPKVDIADILGSAPTTTTSGVLDVNMKNIANAAVSATTAQLGINCVNWAGGAIPSPNVTGTPKVDLIDILGTAVSTPATAGILDVNVKNIGGSASKGAAGYAGVDWGNVNAPTTTVGLTGTTMSTSQQVASVSGAVGSVTGAVGSVTGNVGGNVTGSVGSIAAGGIDITSFNADVASTAYASNTLQQAIYKLFDNAFASFGTWSGYAFTSGGFWDRFTKLAWVLRNQVTINDSSGTTVVYDDGGNQWTSVTGALTDSSGTTERLRIQ